MKLNAIELEVLEALANAAGIATLTTGELATHWVPSAPDRTAVSRAAYTLRQAGLIAAAGEKPSHEGRGARPVVAYQITDAGLDALTHELAAAPEPSAVGETLGFDTTTAEALQQRIESAAGGWCAGQTRACATCQAFAPTRNATDGQGRCRRHAPRTTDGGYRHVWPSVLPDDWCMEWL